MLTPSYTVVLRESLLHMTSVITKPPSVLVCLNISSIEKGPADYQLYFGPIVLLNHTPIVLEALHEKRDEAQKDIKVYQCNSLEHTAPLYANENFTMIFTFPPCKYQILIDLKREICCKQGQNMCINEIFNIC